MAVVAWNGMSKLVIQLCVLRLVAAAFMRTVFSPDEFYQGPEVAHSLVWGYGEVTWEWRNGLRGYLHPMVFAVVFWILDAVKLSTPAIVAIAPNLVQACFQGVTDASVYVLAKRIFGEKVANWTLFVQVVNWFNYYCGVRTFSNSMEATFVAVALSVWPYANLSAVTISGKKAKDSGVDTSNNIMAFTFAALSCALRPTAALFWAALVVPTVLRAKGRGVEHAALLTIIGCLVFVLSTALDSIMYRRFVVVPMNFLMFNLSGAASLYGEQPFHWYFTAGFPIMASTMLPMMLLGGLYSRKGGDLAGAVTFVMLAYSLNAHKEFRFLFPYLGPMMMYAGYCLANMGDLVAVARKFVASARGKTRSIDGLVRNMMAVVLVLTNIPVGIYFSTVHQAGTISATAWIADEVNFRSYHALKIEESVDFLMPCHSSPMYSHVHRPVDMRMLDCSPPGYRTDLSDRADPMWPDEADRFYANPLAFLKQTYGPDDLRLQRPELSWPPEPRREVPTHVVVYDMIVPYIQPFLDEHKFDECAKFSHTQLVLDVRVSENVIIFCRPAHLVAAANA